MFINIHKANVQFENRNPINILEDFNFQMEKGEWVNILGPSGSGKTTLLNVIGGYISLTGGEIKVNGKILSDLSSNDLQIFRRQSIGYIFQDFRLFDQYTVLENVMLPLWPYENKNSLRDKAIKLLAKLNMGHRLDALPNNLSGGEKQRTAIARALINNPDILLCDEPTGNLDEQNRDNILHILKELNNSGITIVLVTHDVEVAEWGHRKLYLRKGNKEQVTA